MATKPELYGQDFCRRTQEQAAALGAKAWDTLDAEHLAEEIESLGRSERYTIESHLERLLLQLACPHLRVPDQLTTQA